MCTNLYDNEKGMLRKTFNKELLEEMGMESVINFIKGFSGWDT